MKLPAIVFSHDAEVQHVLPAYITETFDLPVTVVTSADELRRLVNETPQTLVFFDVRGDAWHTETEQVLTWLESGNLRLGYMVTLTDRWLPFRWAATIDLHETASIDFPCSWETLDRLLAPIKEGTKFPAPRMVPQLQVIESDKFRFSTHTPSLFPVIDQLRRVAAHDVTLLLIGETGTGKTTLAQLIHGLSPRRDDPFLNVACGAMPADLIESELFGHVRGAFTSADRNRIGRFEAAGRGTLLLDEIDALALKEQAKLLRVIETGEFELVGSTEPRISEARLIVASNLDLETLAVQNKFRTDLYYRLNVLQFVLPPVRERPLDVVPMAVQFISECSQRHNIPVTRIHREFISVLKRYQWPGNIREMKNQLQRSVLFCDRGDLSVDHLSPSIVHAQGIDTRDANGQSPPPSWSLAEQVAKSERQILEEALRANGFKRTATARFLGITRVGLYKKMRRHGLLDIDAK